jgi:hypothetical protein
LALWLTVGRTSRQVLDSPEAFLNDLEGTATWRSFFIGEDVA